MQDRSLTTPKILKIWQTTATLNGQTKPVLDVQIAPIPGIVNFRMAYLFSSPSSGFKLTSNISPSNSVFKFAFPENRTVYIKIVAVKNNIIGAFSNVVGGQINIRKLALSNPIIVNGTHVKLSWTEVPGATGYRIWRSETAASHGYTWAINVGNVTAIATAVSPWKTYYYKVAALFGSTTGTPSDPGSFVNRPKAKLETIQQLSPTELLISWNSVPSATGYRIWRSESAPTYGYNWVVNTENTTEITIEVTPGKLYIFKIAPLRGSTVGKLSSPNEGIAMGTPNLYENDNDPNTFELNWSYVPGATGYRLYYLEYPYGDFDSHLDVGYTHNFDFVPENIYQEYKFWIAALFNGREGPWSDSISLIANGTKYQAILMDFGRCNGTSGSQNDEVYRLGNTLRNTISGYIPPFDGVYGPFCPTDSGWDAPLASIGIPDQNDITLIYISGDITRRDQEFLMEI